MAWRPTEARPPTLLYLSVLDSVEHPRLRHRQAHSLVPGYRVVLAAAAHHPTSAPPDGLELRPLPPVGHRSWRRIVRTFELIALLRHERPAAAHLHSIELLLPALLLRPRGCRLVYDRHEDYPRNIGYGTHWPRWLRRPLAALVGRYERWAARRLDGVIYAEREFAGRLPARRSAVVENRYCGRIEAGQPHEKIPPRTPPLLLVSGTIAEEWGLLRSLELWRLWNTQEMARLAVVGRCRDAGLARQARELACSWGLADRLLWEAPPEGVPFERIEAAIEACSLGLALYVLSPARNDRLPSKFYEFMAWRKPLLFTEHPPWTALNDQWQFGVSLPDGPPTAAQVARLVAQHRAGFPACHPQPIPASVWHWQSQGEVLRQFYAELLSRENSPLQEKMMKDLNK